MNSTASDCLLTNIKTSSIFLERNGFKWNDESNLIQSHEDMKQRLSTPSPWAACQSCCFNFVTSSD